MKKLLLATAGCAALMTATSASAADFLFEFSAIDPNDNITFTLDDTVAPPRFIATQFAYLNVPVTTASGAVLAQIDFLNSSTEAGSGFLFFPNGGTFVGYFGAQLFTGPTSDPIFTIGSFALSGTGGTGTLTISEVGSAVPEPATWALMLLGFFAIGAMMRRKPTVNSVSVSYS